MKDVRQKYPVFFHHWALARECGDYRCEVYIDPAHVPAVLQVPGVLLVSPHRGIDCKFTMAWDPRYAWDDIEAAIGEIVASPASTLLDEMPVEERARWIRE